MLAKLLYLLPGAIPSLNPLRRHVTSIVTIITTLKSILQPYHLALVGIPFSDISYSECTPPHYAKRSVSHNRSIEPEGPDLQPEKRHQLGPTIRRGCQQSDDKLDLIVLVNALYVVLP